VGSGGGVGRGEAIVKSMQDMKVSGGRTHVLIHGFLWV
jgi:hypothetical protein